MTPTTDIGLVITCLKNIWETVIISNIWEYNSCAKIKFEIKSDYTKTLRKIKGMIDIYIAIPKKLLYWPLIQSVIYN